MEGTTPLDEDADREAEIVTAIERGLDDLRAARVISHDEAMRRIRETIEKARSAT